MNDRQVCEIAETAFKAHFADIPIVSIDVKHGFDHDNDPLLNVNIVYDGAFEQLNGEGIVGVQSAVIEKLWWKAENSPGWPIVRFIARSDLEQPATATA